MKASGLQDSAAASRARVERLLAAARDTTAKVTDCWVATLSGDGGINVRVVAPLPGIPGEEEWTVCFATRRSSRKAADIQRSNRLTLGYQHHPDRAYVTLAGQAALVEDRGEIRRRWKEKWRLYFPDGPDDPDTALVRVSVDRVELCVPGVTPEPFGSRHSIVGRDACRLWKLVSD